MTMGPERDNDGDGMEEYAIEVARKCKSRHAPCGGCMQGSLCDNYDGIEERNDEASDDADVVDGDSDSDEPEADAALKVSHGWSLMGYYYVSVTTGAEREPFPQTIICKDKAQAGAIAAALDGTAVRDVQNNTVDTVEDIAQTMREEGESDMRTLIARVGRLRQ